MLDRQIEIPADFRLRGHGFEQLRIDFLGITVQNADPDQFRDLRELPKEDVQALFPVKIRAVHGCLLRDEDELRHPVRRERPRFGKQLLHRNAPVSPADARNHAVGTELVAALGDLEIRVMAAGRDHAAKVSFHRPALVQNVRVPFALQRRQNRVRDHIEGRRADQRVHLGHLGKDLLPVALRQAAGHDENLQLRGLLELCEGKNFPDALLLRLVDEAAGVDDRRFRLILIVRQDKTPGLKDPQHLFAVHPVFVAAERNHVQFHKTSFNAAMLRNRSVCAPDSCQSCAKRAGRLTRPKELALRAPPERPEGS